MPTPSIPDLGDNPTQKQIIDYIVKLQRDLNWLLQNLDDLNVRRITADIIYAGTINANNVTIRSDLTSGYINLDGNGLVVNNGSYDTFTADINGKVTMTSALIRSSTGYPYVTMDPNGDLLGAYESASSYITITPTGTANGSPQFSLVGGGGNLYFYQQGSQALLYASGTLILKSSQQDIDLIANNLVNVRFDQLYDLTGTGQTLTEQLSLKATKGSYTGSAGPFNGGIPIGTELMTAGGGTVTWVGIASHSHSQT